MNGSLDGWDELASFLHTALNNNTGDINILLSMLRVTKLHAGSSSSFSRCPDAQMPRQPESHLETLHRVRHGVVHGKAANPRKAMSDRCLAPSILPLVTLAV